MDGWMDGIRTMPWHCPELTRVLQGNEATIGKKDIPPQLDFTSSKLRHISMVLTGIILCKVYGYNIKKKNNWDNRNMLNNHDCRSFMRAENVVLMTMRT